MSHLQTCLFRAWSNDSYCLWNRHTYGCKCALRHVVTTRSPVPQLVRLPQANLCWCWTAANWPGVSVLPCSREKWVQENGGREGCLCVGEDGADGNLGCCSILSILPEPLLKYMLAMDLLQIQVAPSSDTQYENWCSLTPRPPSVSLALQDTRTTVPWQRQAVQDRLTEAISKDLWRWLQSRPRIGI